MPCYPMKCESCGHDEELMQSIKLELPKNCPRCGAADYTQDLTKRHGIYNPYTDYANPKTLGAQADINTRKLDGKRREDAQEKKIKQPKPKKPWWKKVLGK